MRTVALLGLATTAFTFAGGARATCVFEEPVQLRESFPVGTRFDSIRSTPPGGAWWSYAPFDDYGNRCSDFRLETSEGAAIPVDVVHDGPAAIAFRVPSSLAPDTTVEYSMQCPDSARTTWGGLTVTDAEVLPAGQPILRVLGSEVFEWRFPACPDEGQLFMQDQILATTFVDLSLPGDTRQYLLDAWLVEPGDEIPPEVAPRAADAVLLPVGAGDVRLRIDNEGAFDAYFRLTDAVTAAASELVVTTIETPAPRLAGCSSSPAGSPALLTALGLAIRAGSQRRGRQRTEHSR